MGSDRVFLVGGRSFVYIMKSKGLKIVSWGTACFNVPHFEENFLGPNIVRSIFFSNTFNLWSFLRVRIKFHAHAIGDIIGFVSFNFYV